MKTKAAILVIIGILSISCETISGMQGFEVITEAPVAEESITQEPIVADESVVTEAPTEAPIACVTLLTPINGAEIPPVGKVTFSWTPMDEAGNYVLNIILPSGDIARFETDQTFYDRYMEAFVAGGEYQWQVVEKDMNGSEICVSQISTFNKSVYKKPSSGSSDGGNDSSGGSGGTEDPGHPSDGEEGDEG